MTARAQGPRRRGLIARFAALDDGNIIRAAFFLMLAGTAAVLYIDYNELAGGDVSALGLPVMPSLPFLDPDAPASGRPGPQITTDRALHDAPLSVELTSGGVLALTGTIDLGSADRVAAEVQARREYIKTVALDSPGGSLGDALAIGELVRVSGFATSVAAGALCASSCPLILAAGTTRSAAPGAAIGVHQFSAFTVAGAPAERPRAAGSAMSDAQKTTADITRYLTRMGVDPALWIHALETPPQDLYYLSPDELRDYRLVSDGAPWVPPTPTGGQDAQS